MKLLKIFFGSVLVGAGVAVVYHIFETAVHESINTVWIEKLNTDKERAIMVLMVLVVGFVYFASQHFWNRKAENNLGEAETPKPTFINLLKVLFIGFLSLFAGASLGPEAILIPACIIIGGIIGKKAFKEPAIAKLLEATGFIALFVAFFNSLPAALLGVFLLTQQMKVKLDKAIIIFSTVASVSTYIVLQIIEASPMVSLPARHWNLSFKSIGLVIGLIVAGYLYSYLLKFFAEGFKEFHRKTRKYRWWQHALIASSGLAIIFLAGGPLVEFTGNQSIEPMFASAPRLGFAGLLGLLFAKTVAIAWSKNMGYRGGLIFPTILVAAILTAIAQIALSTLSVPIGVIAVLVGAFIGNAKNKALT